MASIIKVDTIQTAAGGTPTAADLGITGTGKVLQVVQGSGSSTTYINSTSMTDIGLDVTITPSSSSSKIALFVSASLSQDDSNGSFAYARLVRGSSTELMEAVVSQDPSTGQGKNSYSLQWLDSPNTTSATTYKVQGRTDNVNSDFRPLASSSIIAFEIAG
jgi:hypothetical protein